jgi:hypothetical protein
MTTNNGLIKISIPDFASRIMSECGLVLNWVNDGTALLHQSSPSADFELEFSQLVARNPSICIFRIQSRFVLVPVSFEVFACRVIDGVEIRDTPRAEAIVSYLEYLRCASSREIDIGAVLKGNFISPVFEDRVTLSKQAQLVQHLCELLGSDRELGFVIDRDHSDGWILSLN